MANNAFAKLMAETKAKAEAKRLAEASAGALSKTPPEATEESKIEAPEQMPSLANPLLVPAKHTLTLTQPDTIEEEAEQLDLTTNGSVHSANELANMDTSQLEPQEDKYVRSELVKAALLSKSLEMKDAATVRALCDDIDAQIKENQRLAGPNLFHLRNHVQRLMVTLKAHPEFDSVLFDADVRNVMTFIRSTREEALALREVKVEKKVAKEQKKSSPKALQADKMQNAFNMLVGFGKPK